MSRLVPEFATPANRRHGPAIFPGYQEYQWLSEFVSNCEEHYIASKELVSRSELYLLGLTDLGLNAEACAGCTFLTDDKKLVAYLASHGRKVDYYQELRARWFKEVCC